jgi:hypothetical protein
MKKTRADVSLLFLIHGHPILPAPILPHEEDEGCPMKKTRADVSLLFLVVIHDQPNGPFQGHPTYSQKTRICCCKF